MTKDEIIDYEQLYESALKCSHSVSWKPSVKSYMLNIGERVLKAEAKLRDGTWKHGNPKPVHITYPKKRDALSIPFKDRVFQRSLNDNAMYPLMTRSFIYDNVACQKGKGPDFAMARLEKALHRYFIHHGCNGYVGQIDITKYYQSMVHEDVNKCLAKKLPKNIYDMAVEILEHQYSGNKGYNPGSQMVQIVGISFLDAIDHFIKEQLKPDIYIRYMDDFLLIHHDCDELKSMISAIGSKLNEIHLSVHPTKTKIIDLRSGFLFIGFLFRITDTGKIIKTLNSQNVKHERRKLRSFQRKVKSGEMTKSKADECFKCWKSHATHGTNYKMLRRMDKYYSGLWRY